jgi:hypothetical protein
MKPSLLARLIQQVRIPRTKTDDNLNKNEFFRSHRCMLQNQVCGTCLNEYIDQQATKKVTFTIIKVVFKSINPYGLCLYLQV